jgi:hypothetical protein
MVSSPKACISTEQDEEGTKRRYRLAIQGVARYVWGLFLVLILGGRLCYIV